MNIKRGLIRIAIVLAVVHTGFGLFNATDSAHKFSHRYHKIEINLDQKGVFSVNLVDSCASPQIVESQIIDFLTWKNGPILERTEVCSNIKLAKPKSVNRYYDDYTFQQFVREVFDDSSRTLSEEFKKELDVAIDKAYWEHFKEMFIGYYLVTAIIIVGIALIISIIFYTSRYIVRGFKQSNS